MHKTSDFNFDLPANLIAKNPVSPRDSARMLVFKNGILDSQVKDLADFLSEGDVKVFNDTKVIKAKLIGKRGEAKIEINLHQNIDKNIWQFFA